ncbi:AAA family ATPase [Planctomicrobium sp. SH664]|uniref:AAA family ATPase n=1 Tax=Planctomicrobium sp. SH664 TaxID=3448125 RepID=UPI003F5CB6AB
MTNDIKRWIPTRWQDVAGNSALAEHFQDILRASLDGEFNGLNTLVTGPSRSGKTAIVKLFARCLYCDRLDRATLTPCRFECKNCTSDVSRFGLQGIETLSQGRSIHYVPIDCTSVTEVELREKLTDLRDYPGFRIVFMDEAHRLVRRSMDEQLLKPVEERANTMWIVTSAVTGELEAMFKKRFVRLQTQLPSIEELSLWLTDRCHEFGIHDIDNPSTIIRLAERSNQIPGDALQVLARAAIKRPKRLTRQLVESHVFELDD